MINYYFDNENELKPYTFQAKANDNTLPPDNALRIEPKFKDGYHPCVKNGKWVLVEDNRDKTVYNIETKEPITIDYLGEIKEGVTLLEPLEFSKWNGEAWELDEAAKKRANVPNSLSRFQAIRVLKSFKVGETTLYKLTNDFINNLDDSIEENDLIIDAWNMASQFERHSPTILMAQKMFQLTDEQVDDMFIQGAEIIG